MKTMADDLDESVDSFWSVEDVLPSRYVMRMYPADFGITGRCFQRFVIEFTSRMHQEVAIFMYHTEENLVGFLIVDPAQKLVILIGDGFREDFKGEGGRGYKKLLEFLEFFGGTVNIVSVNGEDRRPITLRPLNVSEVDDSKKYAKRICEQLKKGLGYYLENEEKMSLFIPGNKIRY